MSQPSAPWVPALPDVTKFGTRLVLTRMALGWSQTQMANVLGVDNTRLSRWEAGANRPRDVLNLVSRVCTATGVHREWLLWGEPVPDGDGDVTTGLLRPLLRIIAFDDAALAA
jgi:transcriptional regulator with XRE-family HTH domain